MRKALRLPTCMIVGLAVLASGCGSTKTASVYVTASTSTNAGTTAPAGSGAQSATQGTNSTQAPQTTATEAKAQPPRALEAKPESKQPAGGAQAVKPSNGSGEVLPPRSHRYPKFFQLQFMVSCKAGGGSRSSCECILITQEKRNVEKGQSMAEVLALDLELKRGISLQKAAHHGVPLPSGVQRAAEACGTSK